MMQYCKHHAMRHDNVLLSSNFFLSLGRFLFNFSLVGTSRPIGARARSRTDTVDLLISTRTAG